MVLDLQQVIFVTFLSGSAYVMALSAKDSTEADGFDNDDVHNLGKGSS